MNKQTSWKQEVVNFTIIMVGAWAAAIAILLYG